MVKRTRGKNHVPLKADGHLKALLGQRAFPDTSEWLGMITGTKGGLSRVCEGQVSGSIPRIRGV